jgi:uncharacterized delta-60 repeat protein
MMLIGVMLLLGLPLGVAAAAGGHGSLDPSFGKRGTVVSVVDPSANAVAVGLVLQPDGKLVVAGECCGGLSKSLMMVRYSKNGSLDRSFGDAGKAEGNVWPWMLAQQPDGKLVVAGLGNGATLSTMACGPCLQLARYSANGLLDRSFGVGGTVLNLRAYGPAGLTVQPDGRIVVADRSSARLFRYTQSGSLDRGFGSRGIVTTRFGTGAWALVLRPDGKIVVAGAMTVRGRRMFALVRYNPNGTLDTSFGRDGTVRTALPGHAAFASLVLQPDGKLVAAGASGRESHQAMLLARYNATGSLDRSFGSDGIVTTRVGADSSAYAVAIQPDGKIVSAGTTSKKEPLASGAHYTFVLARYKPNGTLDHSFGSTGIETTRIGTDSGADTLAIQPDGKLVAAGYSDGEFALARYQR